MRRSYVFTSRRDQTELTLFGTIAPKPHLPHNQTETTLSAKKMMAERLALLKARRLGKIKPEESH